MQVSRSSWATRGTTTSRFCRAREWIAAGRIGTVNFVQSFFGSSPVNLYQGHPEADGYAYGTGDGFDGPLKTTYSDPRLAGGGQGQTQLTHSIALLLFLTGLDPERVAAFMENQSAAVDVVDALSLRFHGGALGVVGSYGRRGPGDPHGHLEYIIHGSAGHIHFDVMDGCLRLYGSDGVTEAPVLPLADRYPMARAGHGTSSSSPWAGAPTARPRRSGNGRSRSSTPPIEAPPQDGTAIAVKGDPT